MFSRNVINFEESSFNFEMTAKCHYRKQFYLLGITSARSETELTIRENSRADSPDKNSTERLKKRHTRPYTFFLPSVSTEPS